MWLAFIVFTLRGQGRLLDLEHAQAEQIAEAEGHLDTVRSGVRSRSSYESKTSRRECVKRQHYCAPECRGHVRQNWVGVLKFRYLITSVSACTNRVGTPLTLLTPSPSAAKVCIVSAPASDSCLRLGDLQLIDSCHSSLEH